MFCTYCGDEFSRVEHLERHVLSHEDVKPHKCLVCQASFGRQDLLQRHLLHLHNGTNNTSEVDIAHVPRLIACVSCAKAKIKCDKVIPSCGRCMSKGLKCQPRTSQHSSEAVLQTKKQFDDYKRLTLTSPTDFNNGGQVRNGSVSNGIQMNVNGVLGTDRNGMQSHSPSSSSQGSPRRQRTHYDPPLSASSMQGIRQDASFAESLQPQPASVTMSMAPPNLSTGAEVTAQSFLTPTRATYNPFEDPILNMDVSDMSNYMDFDPSDPNMFNSPLVLAESLGTADQIMGPGLDSTLGIGRNEMTPQTQENLGIDFEGWPCLTCNPSLRKQVHPKTGRTFLEGLEHILKNHDAVHSSHLVPVQNDSETADRPTQVEPLDSRTRDKLMVITQSILSKARKVHGYRPVDKREHQQNNSDSEAEIFSILPPTEALDKLNRAYARRFEPFYSSWPSGKLDPKAILASSDASCSGLLLLLMLAQGAVATPTNEARYLTSGLTEACRLSWFSLAEKNVALSLHPVMLRSALMFTNLAAWSGVKWHMDLAAAQMDMYVSMLRHSELLSHRERGPRQSGLALDAEWKSWKDYESGNRLAYSWLVVDQELSLFHDRTPKLSLSELNAAIPDQDLLWQAETAEEWSQAYNSIYKSSSPTVPKNPPLLKTVFRRFMSRDPQILSLDFSPTQLRLFLQPLQAMVCNIHQCLDNFLDGGSDRQSQRLVNQLEEVQSILQEWYAMCSRSSSANTAMAGAAFEPATCANLVTYHLISLNTMTNFREMERMARGEVSRDDFRRSYWGRIGCVEEAARIWLHCGQVIRLVRLMPDDTKPLWWPAAVYRVAIIMWATSIANSSQAQIGRRTPPHGDDTFAIDSLTPEHPSMLRYLRYKEGSPVLSKVGGGYTSLEVPKDTLKHCLDVLSQDPAATRLTEGIRWSLSIFVSREGEIR